MKFSQLPPLAKLAIWCGLVVVLACGVQLVAGLFVPEFNILSGGGRGLLLALALASLLAMMAADKRPISQFGLFVGPRWKKLWLGGLGLGAATMSCYLVVAIACGAIRVNFDVTILARLPKALLSAMTVMPLALVQQILFSGYFLSMLRERYRPITAVLVSAFLFAVLGRIGRPEMLLQLKGQSLVIALLLVGTLLGILRLRTGNIIFPSGLLAGWMFVRRLGDKSGLLKTIPDSEWTAWLTPFGDVRQAPVLWLALAVAIAACWYELVRLGETEVPASAPSLDSGFKRIFPFSHTNGLATLDVWLPLLVAARFRVGLAYVPRLVACLVCSALNTLLTLPERMLLPILLRHRQVRDPVVIVGFHRSGTTHLHNLMALDPQFCTPKNIHVMNPAGCVVTGWLVGPLLGAFMPWKRPMDAVRFHLLSPQEDEFGIAGMSPMSPHWGMTFPRQWPRFDRYIFPDRLAPRERARWQRAVLTFLKKVTVWNPRQTPLLKNPYSTGRVGVLHEMFARARFVHIYRNPYDVYRSNQHLAREGHVVNQLHDSDPACSYESRFLDNYRAMEDVFYRDAAKLPPEQVVEVCFEDLEQNAAAELRRIYRTLKLDFTPAYEARLEHYLAEVADYKKNRHRELPDDERQRVEAAVGPLLQRWGYAKNCATLDAA